MGGLLFAAGRGRRGVRTTLAAHSSCCLPARPAGALPKQELPGELGSLPCLEELDVADNPHLAALPAHLGAAPALRVLQLRGCDALGALPAEWLEGVAADGAGGGAAAAPVLPALARLSLPPGLREDPAAAALRRRGVAVACGSRGPRCGPHRPSSDEDEGGDEDMGEGDL
jgi:hypothetical protein